jgi:hypothetical protein
LCPEPQWSLRCHLDGTAQIGQGSRKHDRHVGRARGALTARRSGVELQLSGNLAA